MVEKIDRRKLLFGTSIIGGGAILLRGEKASALQLGQDHISVNTYEELRSLPSASILDGTIISVVGDGITGDFVVNTNESVTPKPDNGGITIVFNSDSNRYAERIFQGALNIRWFGAKGSGIKGDVDDAIAIRKALDYAHDLAEKKSVYAPGGYSYVYKSDIYIGRGVDFYGDGYSTDFVGTGATIRITNTKNGGNSYASVRNMRIRTTDSSTGLRVDGDNVNDAVTRWIVENIWLVKTSGKSGTGFSVSGAWNNTIKGVYISGWDIGVNIEADGPDYSWGLNGSSWTGGQIEGNNTGIKFDSGIAIDFTGVVIEGNTTCGVEIDRGRNITFGSGCYFEGNGEDFRIGENQLCYNITIEKSYFNTSSPFNANAINVALCKGLDISRCRFERYTSAPILISNSIVTGKADNCTKDSATTVGMVDVATYNADRFDYKNADYNLKETELEILDNTITITSDYHTIDTENNAPTGTLSTINGGVRGMILTLKSANSARNIVISETGNIVSSAGSATLNHSDDIIQLIYSEVSGKWLMASLSRNST